MHVPNVRVEVVALLLRLFGDPLLESRLSSNPLCKCWILQPMSNSAPTVRILSKHLLSISLSTRDEWVPVTKA